MLESQKIGTYLRFTSTKYNTSKAQKVLNNGHIQIKLKTKNERGKEAPLNISVR